MADLVIRISGDIKDFKKSLDDAKKASVDLEKAVATAAKVSSAAFVALTGTIGLSIAAYREQELATNQLNAALKNQGIFTQELSDRYSDYASSLQDVTTFGDEEILQAQARLQTYMGQKEITKDLTKVVLDFAAAQGIDAAQAAELVGKSINTSTNALSRYGIEIDNNIKGQARMDAVMEGLNARFKGQAEAAAEGSGVFIQLKNAFSDLAEEIGKNLIPLLQPVVKGLQAVVGWAKEHPELAKFAAQGLVIATAVAGVAAALAVGAVGFLKLREAMLVAQIAMQTMNLSIKGLVAATGIGLLLILVADLAINWKTRFAQMQAIFQAFTNNIANLGTGLANILKGVFTFDTAKVKAGMDQVKNAFVQGFNEYSEIRTTQMGKQLKAEQTQEEQHIVSAAASKKALLEQLNQAEADDRRARFEQSLVENEEFQALTDEQKALFMEQNRTKLEEEQATENEMRIQAAAQRSSQQAKANAQYLADQQKYGQNYAMINKLMHSEVAQGTRTAFQDLAELQQSSNSTLKGIGKAAAIANITFSTAEAAMRIYAGFSTIPIVGHALGIAGAAAAVAFGAEKIGKVTSAADGGLLTGGIPGVDSIPVLAQQQELISPAQNFEEVIGSVAAKRAAENIGAPIGGGGPVELMISMDGDEAEKVLTARQVESRKLGTLREG